jgi:hypothetical protein
MSGVCGTLTAVTISPRRAPRPGLLALLSAAVLALLGTLLTPAAASAAALSATQTRVGAQTPDGAEVHECITAGQHWVRGPSQPRSVVGNCVAAEGTETGSASISDILQPGGNLIGKAGTDASIRDVSGGLPGAQAMFDQLSQGGTVVEQTPYLTRIQLPDGGLFSFGQSCPKAPTHPRPLTSIFPGST